MWCSLCPLFWGRPVNLSKVVFSPLGSGTANDPRPPPATEREVGGLRISEKFARECQPRRCQRKVETLHAEERPAKHAHQDAACPDAGRPFTCNLAPPTPASGSPSRSRSQPAARHVSSRTFKEVMVAEHNRARQRVGVPARAGLPPLGGGGVGERPQGLQGGVL